MLSRPTYRQRAMVVFAILLASSVTCFPQNLPKTFTPTSFRVGEKLTYNISFEKYENSAYAETYVVSRGLIAGHDAVELHSRIKTFGIVSAAFSLIDEERTVFAAADTGLPLFIRKTKNDGPVPKETTANFLTTPTNIFDILTALYKAREVSGNGNFPVAEDGDNSVISFAASGVEKIKTDAGEFDASLTAVQSPYLDARGIKELKIWFSLDENRIPVAFRFRTVKGEFRGRLAAITVDLPPVVVAVPTPIPANTPRPNATPKLQPAATPYIDNQPLLPELAFLLGETLEYKVTQGGRPVARLTFSANERKQFQTLDSLTLTARVTGIDQGNQPFALGDLLKVKVNPDTLTPQSAEINFTGQLSTFNQIALFDQKTGTILTPAYRFDAPVGTHSLLSLIYAMRSFNLKPSKDPGNPVNDTRVAVFWSGKTYIFTLRPSNAEALTINGEIVSAQMVTINTGNPQLDALAIKVWLSTEDGRTPLRFSVGGYQADLVAHTVVKPN